MNQIYVTTTSIGQYAMVLMKNQTTSQVPVTISWVGKSNRSCVTSPIFLQIWNRITLTWEDLDSDTTTPAGVEVVLSATKVSNLGNYYDGSFIIAARVYQQAL